MEKKGHSAIRPFAFSMSMVDTATSCFYVSPLSTKSIWPINKYIWYIHVTGYSYNSSCGTCFETQWWSKIGYGSIINHEMRRRVFAKKKNNLVILKWSVIMYQPTFVMQSKIINSYFYHLCCSEANLTS